MIPSQVPIWLKLSVAKELKTRLPSFQLHVEGFKRDGVERPEWCELRLDLDDTQQLTARQYKILATVDVLCSFIPGNDSLQAERIVGAVVSVLDSHIPLYKFGPTDDALNTQAYFGRFEKNAGPAGTVRVTPFGVVGGRNQTAVTVQYRTFVDV